MISSPEIQSLIEDIKEQVLYMQELGVDSLDIQLPPLAVSEPALQRGAPAAAGKSAYVVPEEPIFKKTAPPTAVPVERPPTDLSRLSRLPTLANRQQRITAPETRQESPKVNVPQQSMAKEKSESVLFDITKALPDVNETVAQIQSDIGDCQRCDLCKERKNIAHSTGSLNADLMFIGEAPGADEDLQGKPFVGRAGQLLTKIIEAIGMTREEVFIGNINRCRPPGNRQPTPAESAQCKPFLFREIAAVKPKVIVVLGNTACQNLLETKVGITKLRGNFQDYFGVKVMPTFHPAYLLRDPSKKRETWDDMKKVRDYLNQVS